MVNLAPSLSAVAERAHRFFAPDTVRMDELQREIVSKLSEIGHVLAVGGIIRDLAFYGADERPISDIDFVVTGRIRKLDILASHLGAEPNRFGGYGLTRNGYRVDFWSLHNTWAKVNRYAKVSSPKDLIRTTFFDWDAIVYDLTCKQIFAIPGYIDRLDRRILDVNLEANPSIHGNLVRALRRLIMWDARPGRTLRKFIEAHLNETDWRSIVEAERKAFNVIYLDQFKSMMDFRSRALSGRTHILIGLDDRRQDSFEFYRNGIYHLKA